ncbi:MAG: DNA recombination protein RmuC [Rickettsiaceae bacterium]
MNILFLILAIVVLLSMFLLYKQIVNKSKISFLQISLDEKNKSFEELSAKYDFVVNEKIENIRHIEQITAKVQQQEKLISDFEGITKKSQELTKAALFELGNDLSKQLIEIHKTETEGSRKLSEENIKATSEKFNTEFERIVNMVGSLKRGIEKSQDTVDLIKNSLLSPSGAGKLAEITLENILKASGLKNGLDFSMQYNLNAENNNKLRPDAVIFLPSDNIMIIDAKASKFLIDESENIEKLIKTMNLHLKSLASKEYAKGMKLAANLSSRVKYANIITLMFLPSEHAIEKIVEADSDFLNKSWNLNIFPVGPAGLMNMLSFAKFQIAENLMFHNNLEIIEEVRKLINSVSSLAEHSAKVGSNISSLVGNYDKFAASFNKNFLSKAKNISNLGVESDLNKKQVHLQRYQLIAGKSEMIELEEEELQQITLDNKKPKDI